MPNKKLSLGIQIVWWFIESSNMSKSYTFLPKQTKKKQKEKECKRQAIYKGGDKKKNKNKDYSIKHVQDLGLPLNQ